MFIDDEVPDIPRARVFDPLKHCFNPLKEIDYKRARQLGEVLYAIAPQGENTLTVRNGNRALVEILAAQTTRLDKLRIDTEKNAPTGYIEANDAVKDILISPVLRRALCNPTDQFSFNPRSIILARINRAELGDFDALVLGLFLMSHYKGQVVVPDFGFYGREGHVSLIRERRLIAGINFLGELSPKLGQNVLLIKDKVASSATTEDAEMLAHYERLIPNTNGFNEYVQAAIA